MAGKRHCTIQLQTQTLTSSVQRNLKTDFVINLYAKLKRNFEIKCQRQLNILILKDLKHGRRKNNTTSSLTDNIKVET